MLIVIDIKMWFENNLIAQIARQKILRNLVGANWSVFRRNVKIFVTAIILFLSQFFSLTLMIIPKECNMYGCKVMDRLIYALFTCLSRLIWI